MTIYLSMKDGSKRVFEDNGASAGSYSQSMRSEIGFVVITDAYGKAAITYLTHVLYGGL